ncbi:MAG: SDR family NAD(P)-dependent oxidoreductase [Rhodobacterales bacterium]
MAGASGRRRRAFVTGASSGLGAGICLELARRGWDVVGVSRRGIVPQGEAPLPGRMEGRTLDVTDLASVEAMIAQLDGAGGIDLYVLNAGANIPAMVEDLPMADTRAIMETNFWGVVNFARTALPGLRARGGGTICVVGSLAGKITPPGRRFMAQASTPLKGGAKAFCTKSAASTSASSLWHQSSSRHSWCRGFLCRAKPLPMVISMPGWSRPGMSMPARV